MLTWPAWVLLAPRVIWLSDPVGPDETLLLTGAGLREARVEVGRLPDDAPAGEPWSAVSQSTVVRPLLTDDTSLQAVVPGNLQPGMMAIRLTAAGASTVRLVNAPEVWWLQGDQGDGASPGGWVRLFGRNLGGDRPARIRLRGASAATRELPAQRPDAWSLRVPLPTDLPPSEYAVEVHNGWGGAPGWQPAGGLEVAQPVLWKDDVFPLTSFAGDADAALRAALAKVAANGGGVVLLPRGRFQIKGELALPPGTVLRGAGMGLTSLAWPDLAEPPAQLIGGRQFGLEDLAIYCQHHQNVVNDQDGSRGTFLRRVRIRANSYFMIEDAAKPFRGRSGPSSHKAAGAAVMLRARGFEVTGCDIYATNYALRLHRAQVGVVAGNQFRYGGRGYTIEHTDKLIFEDNLVEGNHLLAIGNDVTTFWNSYCRNLYYARNTVRQMYGADREMMTLDAGGGAYFGTLAAVDGRRLTLAADPVFKDYAPRPHTDWRGAALILLDGPGAGQWRQVTANAGREWEVDRPWDVPPDQTTQVSIVPHRGRHLFIANDFSDGGAFQLYGAALDTVVAGNRGRRMDGFLAWGLNPHDWGWQPCFNVQFLDNEVLEGNGYGTRGAMVGAFTSGNATYAGPLARALVFRRNVLHNNARMRFHSALRDVLVERNSIRQNDLGITVGRGPVNLLLRQNRFDEVRQPLEGDGLAAATVVP